MSSERAKRRATHIVFPIEPLSRLVQAATVSFVWEQGSHIDPLTAVNRMLGRFPRFETRTSETPRRHPTARASASPLLTPSPRALCSHACPCDYAGALATRIAPLQCGCRIQQLAPPLLTVALCASQPRSPRREPVHPYCSRRLHGHHAHVRAPVIAPATLPRASLLCSVAAAHDGWRHHCSRSHCVPHSRDPHGES